MQSLPSFNLENTCIEAFLGGVAEKEREIAFNASFSIQWFKSNRERICTTPNFFRISLRVPNPSGLYGVVNQSGKKYDFPKSFNLKGKDIFGLVSQLTKADKIRFKNFLSQKHPDLSKIFDTLNGQSEYSSDKFGQSKELYRKFDNLRDVIFQALSDGSPLGRVKLALQFGEVQYALKSLQGLMEDFWKKERLWDLLEAHRLFDKLKKHSPNPISIPHSVPNMSQTRNLAYQTEQLEYLYQLARKGKDLPPNQVQFSLASIKGEVLESAPQTPFQIYLRFKILSTIEFLLENYSNAHRFQMQVVSSLENWELDDLGWITELSLLANVCIQLGLFEDAKIISSKMSFRDLRPAAHSKRLIQALQSSLFIALGSGDFEFGIEQIQNQNITESSISDHKKALLFHSASLLGLYTQNYSLQVKMGQELRGLPRKAVKRFEWANSLVLWTAYNAIGEIDLVESFEKRLQRFFSKMSEETPKVFFRYLNGKISPQEALDKILSLKSIPNESLTHSYFHFEEYLVAVLRGKTISEVFSERSERAIKDRLGSQ